MIAAAFPLPALAKMPPGVMIATALPVIGKVAGLIGNTTGAGVLKEAKKLFKLAKMLNAGLVWLPWSFLAEPLRPPLALPPNMAEFTKAATPKHATIILMGVERVMLMVVVSRNVKLFRKDIPDSR
jgi:hypothetical protein